MRISGRLASLVASTSSLTTRFARCSLADTQNTGTPADGTWMKGMCQMFTTRSCYPTPLGPFPYVDTYIKKAVPGDSDYVEAQNSLPAGADPVDRCKVRSGEGSAEISTASLTPGRRRSHRSTQHFSRARLLKILQTRQRPMSSPNLALATTRTTARARSLPLTQRFPCAT